MTSTPTKSKPRFEFIALMACLVALEAFSIDSMLPALGQIGADLGIAEANDRQFIITSIFLGVAVGILGYGIAGDSLGRKRPIYFGMAVFIFGTVLCAMSTNFLVMLAGRFFQGFGSAGPYVLSTAIIRDRYEGSQMAQIMSLIFMIFIIIPAVAPLLGQIILLVSSWRSIFIMLGVFAGATGIWFAMRQPETLPPDDRVPLSFKQSYAAIKEVLGSRKVLSIIIAEGLVFGTLVTFLSTSQQVFQEQYQLGATFPLYFALMALFAGIAAFFNSRWVIKYGMYVIVSRSLVVLITLSILFIAFELSSEGGSPLGPFMIYMLLMYFFLGLLFGNLTSMAMEPMGHIAGVASAVVGAVSTIIGAVTGGIIGSFYDGYVLPIVIGFAVLCIGAKWLIFIGENLSSESAEAKADF